MPCVRPCLHTVLFCVSLGGYLGNYSEGGGVLVCDYWESLFLLSEACPWLPEWRCPRTFPLEVGDGYR